MKFLLQRACVLPLSLFKTYCKCVLYIRLKQTWRSLTFRNYNTTIKRRSASIKAERLQTGTFAHICYFVYILFKLSMNKHVKCAQPEEQDWHLGKKEKYSEWYTAFFERDNMLLPTIYSGFCNVRTHACVSYVHVCATVCVCPALGCSLLIRGITIRKVL